MTPPDHCRSLKLICLHSKTPNMATGASHKELPQLPPKPGEAVSGIESSKVLPEPTSKAEKLPPKANTFSQDRIPNPQHTPQPITRGNLRPSLGPHARTSTADRLLINKIYNSPQHNLRKDIDQALPKLEKMNVQARTELVVHFYNRLEKARRDRLLRDKARLGKAGSTAGQGGRELSREEVVWERGVRQRLRML